MLSANSMYPAGELVDAFSVHGIPMLIAGSFTIGAIITVYIAHKKGSGFFFGVGFISAFVATGVLLFNLICLGMVSGHNTSVTQQQASTAETYRQLEEIANSIEEEYGFTPTIDLISTLLGETPASSYENGKGEGMVWRSEPAEYLIHNQVYILQLAWAGDKWLILDVTEGETIQLTELDLTGN